MSKKMKRRITFLVTVLILCLANVNVFKATEAITSVSTLGTTAARLPERAADVKSVEYDKVETPYDLYESVYKVTSSDTGKNISYDGSLKVNAESAEAANGQIQVIRYGDIDKYDAMDNIPVAFQTVSDDKYLSLEKEGHTGTSVEVKGNITNDRTQQFILKKSDKWTRDYLAYKIYHPVTGLYVGYSMNSPYTLQAYGSVAPEYDFVFKRVGYSDLGNVRTTPGYALLTDAEQKRVMDILGGIGALSLDSSVKSKREQLFSVYGAYTEAQAAEQAEAIRSLLKGYIFSSLSNDLSNLPGADDVEIETIQEEYGNYDFWRGTMLNGTKYTIRITDDYAVQMIDYYVEDQNTAITNGKNALEAIKQIPYPLRKNIKTMKIRNDGANSYNCGTNDFYMRLNWIPSVNNIAQYMTHEFGHSMDYSYNVNGSGSWPTARNADMMGVTSYGNSNNNEDFAEFSKSYFQCYGNINRMYGLRQVYPERYSEFVKVLLKTGYSDIIGEKIQEIENQVNNVGKAELETLLNNAKKEAVKIKVYTAGSLVRLNSTITNAQNIVDNTSATQNMINDGYGKLLNAMNRLEFKVKDTVINSTKVGASGDQSSADTGTYLISTKTRTSTTGSAEQAAFISDVTATGNAENTGAPLASNRIGYINFALDEIADKEDIEKILVSINVTKVNGNIDMYQTKAGLFEVATLPDSVIATDAATYPATNNDYSQNATIYSEEWIAENNLGVKTFDVTEVVKEALDAGRDHIAFRLQTVISGFYFTAEGENAPKLIIKKAVKNGVGASGDQSSADAGTYLISTKTRTSTTGSAEQAAFISDVTATGNAENTGAPLASNRIGYIDFALDKNVKVEDIGKAVVSINVTKVNDNIGTHKTKAGLFQVAVSPDSVVATDATTYPAVNNDYSKNATVFSEEWIAADDLGVKTFDVTDIVKDAIKNGKDSLSFRLQTVISGFYFTAEGENAPQLTIHESDGWLTRENNNFDISGYEINTRESEHFRMIWGNGDPNLGNGDLDYFIDGNLQNLENIREFYINELGLTDIGTALNNPDGNKYKMNVYIAYTGLWDEATQVGVWDNWAYMGADSDYAYLVMDADAMRVDPPSWTVPHELAHAFTYHMGNNIEGDWYEPVANFCRNEWLKSDYNQFNGKVYGPETDFIDPMLLNTEWRMPSKLKWYEIWPILTYIYENPDNVEGLGKQAITKLFQKKGGCFEANCTCRYSNGNCFKTIEEVTGVPIQDILGGFERRLVTMDFKEQSSYQKDLNRLKADPANFDKMYTTLENSNDGWLTVPDNKAPQQTGFNIIPLEIDLTKDILGVDFQGLSTSSNAGWRISIVTETDSGETRYSSMWNEGYNFMQLQGDEKKAYLVVSATPNALEHLSVYKTDGTMDEDDTERYPYKVKITMKNSGDMEEDSVGTPNIGASGNQPEDEVQAGKYLIATGNKTNTLGSADQAAFIPNETATGTENNTGAALYSTRVGYLNFTLDKNIAPEKLEKATVSINVAEVNENMYSYKTKAGLYRVATPPNEVNPKDATTYPAVNGDYSKTATVFSNEWIGKEDLGVKTFDVTEMVKAALKEGNNNVSFRLQTVISGFYFSAEGENIPKLTLEYSEENGEQEIEDSKGEDSTEEDSTEEDSTEEDSTKEDTTKEDTTKGETIPEDTTAAVTVPTTEQVLNHNPGLPIGKSEEAQNSRFGVLKAQVKKTTKNSNKVQWSVVPGADGYIVLGNRCNKGGKKYKVEVLTITNNAKKSYTHKKLLKDTYYKYIVQAYKMKDGKIEILETSKTIYSVAKYKKYANVKSIKVNKSKVVLAKKGKTFKLKATMVKNGKKLKTYRKLMYESSDTSIATVTKKGVIKAKKKGTCTIYVYAQNGVYKKVKVRVKK